MSPSYVRPKLGKGWVIGFGCARLDRVVKVALPRRPAPNENLLIDCPCGAHHRPSPLIPRRRRRGEDCDVELPDL